MDCKSTSAKTIPAKHNKNAVGDSNDDTKSNNNVFIGDNPDIYSL